MTGWWAWISGSYLPNNPGSYGAIGLPSASDFPSARHQHSMVINPVTGIVYIFGGVSQLWFSTATYYWSDLWQWDSREQMWTWLSGEQSGNQPPRYGIKGIASSANKVGSRSSHSMAWNPNTGSILIFGGNNGAGSTNERLHLNHIS